MPPSTSPLYARGLSWVCVQNEMTGIHNFYRREIPFAGAFSASLSYNLQARKLLNRFKLQRSEKPVVTLFFTFDHRKACYWGGSRDQACVTIKKCQAVTHWSGRCANRSSVKCFFFRQESPVACFGFLELFEEHIKYESGNRLLFQLSFLSLQITGGWFIL